MKRCIYCLRGEGEVEFTDEHVIPRAFGVFGDKTPVLQCVCGPCNQFFGDHLDIVLTRDSLEAMERFKHGPASSAKRPHKRVTMEIAEEERPVGMPKLQFEMDGSRRKVDVKSLVRFVDEENKEQVDIPYDKIATFDITPWLKRKLSITFMGGREESKQVHERLKERGIKFTAPFTYTELQPIMGHKTSVLIEATGLVDETIKRAVAKILFNFAAYTLGDTEVLAAEWNAAREYIREGKGKIGIDVRRGVFWDDETEHITYNFPRGTNIKIENKGGGVAGLVQFFHLMIYEVELSHREVPESKLVGFIFSPGHKPAELRPMKMTAPLFVAHYDVDRRGRAKLNVRKYG